jgi:mRNA interferase RelE/StbE
MSSRYRLLIEPKAYAERKSLPGHVRGRVRQAIEGLATDPRPVGSQTLDVSGLDIPPEVELRRIRLDRWRVIYAVCDAERWIWVWGVRRRPPYDYDDLPELVSRI